MTDDQWPTEVTDFYQSLSLGDGPRANITQTHAAVLETRKWKRIAGGLAVACTALVALSGFAFLQQDAERKVVDVVGEIPIIEEIPITAENQPRVWPVINVNAARADEYNVMAVYVHRDWCGKCKKMGNLFAVLQQDLSERRVMFLRVDLTDPVTTRQSALLGERLKINEALEGIESGKIVLLDRTGQRLETLDGLSGREYLSSQIAMRAG